MSGVRRDLPYVIREARWSDCGALSRKLCDGRWLAYKQAGVDARASLRALWGASLLVRRTCLIDGRIVAMWGMSGSLLSRTGGLWMVIAPEAATHPYALLREVRAQIIEFARIKRDLRATVAAQDGTAQRFAKWLGFVDEGPPIQIGETGVMIIPMAYRPGG